MAHTHAASWGRSDDGSGRWGHWGPQILVAVILGTVVLVVVPPPTNSPLALLGPVLLLAVAVTTWPQVRRHDRRLCEHCVASMPLNPAAEAQRLRRRLALVHLSACRPALAAYVLVLLASDVVLVIVPPSAFVPAAVVWVVTQSSLIYLVLSYVTHRRLQPWCAECDEGGGGRDDEDAPSPQPIDSSSR